MQSIQYTWKYKKDIITIIINNSNNKKNKKIKKNKNIIYIITYIYKDLNIYININ